MLEAAFARGDYELAKELLLLGQCSTPRRKLILERTALDGREDLIQLVLDLVDPPEVELLKPLQLAVRKGH